MVWHGPPGWCECCTHWNKNGKEIMHTNLVVGPIKPYLYIEWIDYVTEAIKSHAVMHNFVPGVNGGGVVVVCGLYGSMVPVGW